MRPHRPTFAGIGTYPGKVEVDFDALNQKGLYLIVGPTGAGKTTILDAITYALYGKVAQGRTLVSTHDGALPAMVELEFSHGTRRYTVHRELAPPGKSAHPHKQWIRTLEAGVEVATETGAQAVNKSCARIVGLSADEFMQVILLPQGKFQQFLLATGGEKQSVLKSIFRTSTYERLTQHLNDAAEQLRLSVAKDEERAGQQWAVIDSALETLRGHETFDAQPDTRPDPLPMVAFLEKTTAELDLVATKAGQRQSELAADRKAAETLAKRFDDAAQLEQLRSDHEAERQTAEALRGKIAAHNRSEPVIREADVFMKAVNEAKTLAAEVATARTQLQRETTGFKVKPSVVKTWSGNDCNPRSIPGRKV
jgi:exonuclease SbcC